MFAVAGGGDTSTHLLRMLIASHSKAHSVHRKLEEEELFVPNWEKELPGPAGKGSKAPSFFKSTLQTGATQTQIRTVPASENCEVATLPPAHDFARACLGHVGNDTNALGSRNFADHGLDCLNDLVFNGLAWREDCPNDREHLRSVLREEIAA